MIIFGAENYVFFAEENNSGEGTGGKYFDVLIHLLQDNVEMKHK